MVVELIMRSKHDLDESKLRLKLKEKIVKIESDTAPSKSPDLSKYDNIIKVISIASYFGVVLTYFILLETGYLS